MAKKDEECYGSLSESDQTWARDRDTGDGQPLLEGLLICLGCGAKVGAVKSPMSKGEGFYVPYPRPHDRPKKVFLARKRGPGK